MSQSKVDVLAVMDSARNSMGMRLPGELDVCRAEMAEARAAVAELIENTEKALNIAESWIHDQLDGTPSLNESLSELDSVRAILARVGGAA